MFHKLFYDRAFPNLPSFGLALGLFAFNLFIVCLLGLLRAVHAIPDPVTQLANVGSIEDARGLMIVAALWSIGNTLLLLGVLDAFRMPPTRQ